MLRPPSITNTSLVSSAETVLPVGIANTCSTVLLSLVRSNKVLDDPTCSMTYSAEGSCRPPIQKLKGTVAFSTSCAWPKDKDVATARRHRTKHRLRGAAFLAPIQDMCI